MSGSRERTKPIPTRPLVPRLAATASNFKSTSTPAPRLAASAQSPSPSIITPNGIRRPAITHTPVVSPRMHTASDSGTPDSLIDSPNVTPRSAARRSRADSIHLTPTGLPGADHTSTNKLLRPVLSSEKGLNKSNITPRRPNSSSSRPGSAASRSSKPSDEERFYRADVAQASHSTASLPQIATEITSQKPGSSFFHASEARTQAPPRPALQKKKSSTFIHADGRRDSEAPSELGDEITSNISKTQGQFNREFEPDSIMPKVAQIVHFGQHAFDHASTDVSRALSSSPSKAISSVPSSQSPPPFFRSPSPIKDNFHLSYRKGISQIMRPRPAISPTRPLSSSSRRRSVEKKDRRSSLDTVPEPEDVGETSPSNLCSPEPVLELSNPISPMMAALDMVASPSLSPTVENSYVNSSLVADARMERKVLDLEISNSSLLVINRSLEREIRKQKAELRSLRRITRRSSVAALRTSWVSEVNSSVGNLDAGFLLTDVEGEKLDDDELDEEDASEPDDSSSPSATSPRALAHHDAKHRDSDQRRLQLELSKHKELLIDSQKMNLSLKKCLDMTEQLIKDATKAIEWKVELSDVKLGGRVLFGDDVDATDHYETDLPMLSHSNNSLVDGAARGREMSEDQQTQVPDSSPSYGALSISQPVADMGETCYAEPDMPSQGADTETFSNFHNNQISGELNDATVVLRAASQAQQNE